MGSTGEDIACEFLTRKGYTILQRNLKVPWGEVDVVGEKDGVVRFIEVKSTLVAEFPDFSRENWYRPEELVHEAKLKKISSVATSYMNDRRDEREYQIDVVAVYMHNRARKARCKLLEHVA